MKKEKILKMIYLHIYVIKRAKVNLSIKRIPQMRISML